MEPNLSVTLIDRAQVRAYPSEAKINTFAHSQSDHTASTVACVIADDAILRRAPHALP